MGFSSKDCRGCGHPLLGPHATNATNRWMSEAVLILPNWIERPAEIHAGEFDGYMRFGSYDPNQAELEWETLEKADTWHRSCWVLAGKPDTAQGGTPWSDDQGWFFNPGDHDLPDPLLKT